MLTICPAGIVTDGEMAANGLTGSIGITDTSFRSPHGKEIRHLSTRTSR